MAGPSKSKSKSKSQEPYRFDFGKHKGMTLLEVPPSYISWLVGEGVAETRPELKKAINAYMKSPPVTQAAEILQVEAHPRQRQSPAQVIAQRERQLKDTMGAWLFDECWAALRATAPDASGQRSVAEDRKLHRKWLDALEASTTIEFAKQYPPRPPNVEAELPKTSRSCTRLQETLSMCPVVSVGMPDAPMLTDTEMKCVEAEFNPVTREITGWAWSKDYIKDVKKILTAIKREFGDPGLEAAVWTVRDMVSIFKPCSEIEGTFAITMLSSPLTVLSATASTKPTALAFKIPVFSPTTGVVTHWRGISYAEFARDVDGLARVWEKALRKDGVERGAVIALCVGGFEYLDVVHLYSISRAGYVPHIIGRLPGIEIVKDLLRECDTKALIRSGQFKDTLKSVEDMGMPVYDASSSLQVTREEKDGEAPTLRESDNPDDVLLIAHTSGSTGRPKIVRFTRRWVDGTICKGNHSRWGAASTMTFNWMGNVCHMGQVVILANIQNGDCTIQARDPRNPFDFHYFFDCIRRASLNHISLYCPLLVKLLQIARSNPEVLDLLKSLQGMTGGGAVFPNVEEEWAASVGLNVIVAFGSTEVGASLITKGTRSDPTGAFYILDSPGISYQFDSMPDAEGLLELVVRSDSIDCPGEEFRSKEDGHFHTGDLWVEVETEGDGSSSPGEKKKGYWYRGRDDDWIKTELASRCDTKAIEDSVRRTCSDLISDCIVVGYGRPSPTLFIEPATALEGGVQAMEENENLKQMIFERIRPFNSLFRTNERIASPTLILVVPRNTLPRTETKGNIRRKAVEDMFKEDLDRLYASGV
ncbi:hypothetical protein V5O48_005883 [Marasmius crinis-equi]|uniref:AMP-dependent synthetase/ligase domain-containing protein n=1 Tax=Marasmius crinis-equi TaxID=585013 RepID=A0ABR3FL08_9AGAR